MKRLKLFDIVRLRRFDEFTLVVPPFDRKQPKQAIPPRKDVVEHFRRVILAAAPRGLNKEAREERYDKDTAERTVSMEGKDHFEYNVRVASYPERSKLEGPGLSRSEIDRMLGEGNSGMHLELIGHGSTEPLFLPLAHFQYLYVFVPRKSDGPFLDESLEFPVHRAYRIEERSWPEYEEAVLNQLVRELYATKGDPVAYTQIMMNYYRTMFTVTKNLLPAPDENRDDDVSNEQLTQQQQDQPQQDIYGPHWEQLFFQLLRCRANNNGSFAIAKGGYNARYCEINLGHGMKQKVNIGEFVCDLRSYKQLLTERDQNAREEMDIEKKASSILTPDRIKVLDSLGFVWTQNEGGMNNARWEEWYNELVRHHAQHGNCEPTNNNRLNQWCQSQRALNSDMTGATVHASASGKKKAGKVGESVAETKTRQYDDAFKKGWEERKAKLDKLGFVWSMRKRVVWEDRFEQLKQFKAEHGHCDVPKSYALDKSLWKWCKKNRLQYLYYTQGKKESQMTAKRM